MAVLAFSVWCSRVVSTLAKLVFVLCPALSLCQMTTTSLKRFGQNVYTAMLVSMDTPARWSQPTVLCRFVEESGASTAFIVTGEAIVQFQALDRHRIYTLEVPGSLVKSSKGRQSFGIDSVVEVVVRFPLRLALAKESWPLRLPYKFVSWTDLPQLEDRSFFDLLGKVLEKPVLDASTQLPRLNVVMCNGNLQQTVHFLGHHSSVVLQSGDVVALSGMRLHTWRQERTLETSFLTVVEVNPLPRGDLFEVLDKDEGTHRRKALRITTPSVLRVSDVQSMMHILLDNAPTDEQREFTITGRLPMLTDDFFDIDPPIKGDGPTSKMCWQTHLEDNTGRLAVRLWDKACFEVFHVAAPELRSM